VEEGVHVSCNLVLAGESLQKNRFIGLGVALIIWSSSAFSLFAHGRNALLFNSVGTRVEAAATNSEETYVPVYSSLHTDCAFDPTRTCFRFKLELPAQIQEFQVLTQVLGAVQTWTGALETNLSYEYNGLYSGEGIPFERAPDGEIVKDVFQNEVIVTDFIISKASLEKNESIENKNLYTELLKDLGLDNNPLFDEGISIPHNLIIIGTVNMDETTHSFSRKVLDRAMTFEMNNIDLNAGLDKAKNDWSYPQDFITSKEVIGEFTSGAEVVNEFAESKKVIDFLINLNNELEDTPFKIAYRVRDEFLIYCYYASLNSTDSNWLTNAFDEMTSMKILSRIEGDETKTGLVLRDLQRVLTADYKKSNAKLKEMETRLLTSGYTSFWS